MVHIISLDDDAWELREALGDTWQWYAATPAERRNSVTAAARTDAWLPARVPGSVIDDLVRAGEAASPYVARRSREAEWAADRHWVYRRHIDLPALARGETVWLELDGVDPAARVLWDGRPLGEVNGIHHRARFAAGVAGDSAVAAGSHTLVVVVSPALDTEPQVGRTDRVRRLHPRVGSGWDFSPRLRHQGIWRGTRLVIGETVFSALSARSALDASGDGRVTVEGSIDGPAPAEVTLAVSLRGREAATPARVTTGADGRFHAEIPVADPERWHPIGRGQQTRYTLTATVGDDVRELRLGFRDARLVAAAGAPLDALPYSALLNGRSLPLVGWNWAPADVLFGTVTPDRVRHLLTLAAESGARIIRVWGGGLVESEEFYDICDELGLLVWQEFSQSSSGMQSAPADDADFIDHAVDEAERAVARIGHHPSLFLWCGGNELEDDAGPLDESRSPVLAALRATLRRVDPDRSWLPTSPSGPTFHHRLDRIAADPDGQHDVHGPWEHQGLEGQHTLADAGTSLAHTEFGVEGMASLRSLERLIPAEQRWPADRSNPVYRHLGEWWNNAELVDGAFGGRLRELDTLQRASQWLQATGLQYAIEADRRRWPRCSMVLPWQLAESFPNAWCTSVVEWSGEAKPAFHAVRRAFARNRVTVRTPRSAWAGHRVVAAQAWAWSEDGIPAGSRVTLRCRTLRGDVRAETSRVLDEPIGDPLAVAALEVPHPRDASLLIWEAEWTDGDGRAIDRERSVATFGSDFGSLTELPAADVAVDVAADGDTWHVGITHVGGDAVIGGRLMDGRPPEARGFARVHDDPRPLLAGESRRLRVDWSGVPAAERILAFDAWNVSRREVRTGVSR